MQISTQQQAFFDTFGFLAFPGLLREDAAWITSEFEAVFSDRGIVHDPARRTCVVPFADQRAKLCALLDHPSILRIAEGLLGEDFNYLGSDGNYYSGDTPWHSDGFHSVGKFIKIAFYLDPVARDTGCLRVIPGTHREQIEWDARQAARSQTQWGIEGRDVPCVPLETQPGDVVVFNHNLMHAAFGGSASRRMFTLNLCRRCQGPDEIADLEDFINGGARFWIEQMHSDLMRETASPARMRHLQQVIEHEGGLPALAAKARATMKEPARG